MQILFIGDIIGRPGRETVKAVLPELKKSKSYDLVIANAENLSHGKGATLKTIEEMLDAGINFFTSGNHIWRNNEIFAAMDDPKYPLIRPANYPPGVPGRGFQIVKTGLLKNLLVINLIGRVFFPQQFDCPFRKADDILSRTASENPDLIFVDFHAEASSEKIAMKHYLNGRVQAIVGTHTHIPTADGEVTADGMAYITDVGMTGLKNGIIGVDTQNILKQFLTQLPAKHEISSGPTTFNAVEIEFENNRAIRIEPIIKHVTL